MSRTTQRASSPHTAPHHRWLRRVPGLTTVREYQRSWLRSDVVAGLVLTSVLVPAGMGYAEAAHLPPIVGLYATIACTLAYALFGPSRFLVLGPDSALGALIASIVLPIAGSQPERLIVMAGMLAILSGMLCVLVGLFRLGFVTDLLSKPIREGYLNGVALTVVIGQAPKLLGFGVDGSSLTQEAIGFVRGVLDGKTNEVACALGVASLIVIFSCKRWVPRVPGILVAVVGAAVAVAVLKLDRTAGVPIVGAVPRGLPQPAVPWVSLQQMIDLLPGAVAVALISLADISVLSRVFAGRTRQQVDRDQELVALGAANIVAGLFQGFPVTSSSSRTAVAESSGACSQLTGVIAALCVAALLMFAPTLLRTLPTAALAAVVIAAALGLFEIRSVLALLRLRPSEFLQSVACFAGVALVGVIQGIFIAIGLALLAFVWRAWRPYDAVLGRVEGRKGYHDVSRHPEARHIPGLVLFRWDAPLFFANADIFRDHVWRAIAAASTPTRWVVVAAEPITDVDVTAAGILRDLRAELNEQQIELYFAEMKGPVKDLLIRYGVSAGLIAERAFPTIGVAVDAYLEQHADVEWRDWDD
ncbi:SulP family inorganic anion transporter [Paraburkholderia rhizosphaerae]|uniref:High affinity sulfate transporter 1 n=1 Tax=Paraburkholderia rhizosphaerae TaxID=480658 RepID=A0A4R8LGF5_9BURK|nr:SulP family inorganic anion transporter [Paraburkholderia rhizosphaerae]TDY42226.1 high affinity sulfate transporter 1 [Paraburkholderia rhizosphaerae]